MSQIVASSYDEKSDTFIIQVKRLAQPRLSSTGQTVQIAGVNGFAERMGLNYTCPITGKQVALVADVKVRYANPVIESKPVESKPVLTVDALKAALARGQKKVAASPVPAK